MRRLVFLLAMGCFFCHAQVEKIYDDKGMLREVNPLNREGTFEGIGYTFYPNGAREKEIPYENGVIHGEQREYYEDGNLKAVGVYVNGKQEGTYRIFFPEGNLKLKQNWKAGKRHGDMEVFLESGELRIYALLKNDSILFAQNFDKGGKLLSERMGYINQELDSTGLPRAKVFYENGNSLRSNVPTRVQVIQPKIPTSFLGYTSQDAEIQQTEDQNFPLLITPTPGKKEVELYLLIKLHPQSQPTVKRKLVLPVK